MTVARITEITDQLEELRGSIIQGVDRANQR